MNVYEAYEIAIESGDKEQLKAIFPKHWLITGIKPTLTKKELAFADKFPEAYEMKEVDEWVTNAYVLSGKHSYEQLAVYIPAGVQLRLEYENHTVKHAWLIENGIGTDVAHQIPFIESIPSEQNPMKSGFVHGVIYGCDDISAELQKIDTSVDIPKLKFVVCYLIDKSINSMLASLDTHTLLGFTVAMRVPVTVNKWDAVKKSASLAIGSGAAGYECYKILVMHDDYRLIDKLQGKDINRWGFIAHIKHPRILGEVKSVDWRTEIFEHKVVVIPHVVFSINNDSLFDVGVPGLKKSTDGFAEMRVNYADIISGNYRIGDVVAFMTENQKFTYITLEMQGKSSGVTPSGCPKCGHMLDVWMDKVVCTNPKCVEIIRNNIGAWINAYCTFIDEDVLMAFIRTYGIVSVTDIYTTFDRRVISEEKFAWILKVVEHSRSCGLSKFISLICPKITDVEAERMVNFARLDVATLCDMSATQMENVTGMTSDKAADVFEWFVRNRTWFKHTLDAFAGDKILKSKLFGKTFIISGLLYERDKLNMETKIREFGGRVVDTNKGVDYVIAGQFADEKLLKRAKELHVPPVIISETSFQDFIKDCATSA